MIDYQTYKEYFENDSVDKQWKFESFDPLNPSAEPEITITNSDLIAESIETSESLCTEENIRFNCFENNMLKFSVRNTLPNLVGVRFRVKIEFQILPGVYGDPFIVGSYRVHSDKVSSDRETRDIVAYDLLYKFMNTTHKKWYNNLFDGAETVTLKEFRDSFFSVLFRYHPWISQEQTTLVNDTIEIKKSKKIKKPTTRDILNVICELNGVIGHIGRDNVFRYIDVCNPSNTYQIGESLSIANEYDDYHTSLIDRIEILSQSGEVLGYAGAEEDEAENTYTIENNFALKGLGDEEDAQIVASNIALNLMVQIGQFTFMPFDAEFKGNPCFEVGDWIGFSSHGQDIYSVIMSRSMRGLQSLRDTYSASGDKAYPGDANTLSDRIKNLEQQIGKNDPATNVQVTPLLTEGVAVAKIIIDGTEYTLYAPQGGGGGGGSNFTTAAHDDIQLVDYTVVN